MKKSLLFLAMISLSALFFAQQDTVIGFTFPDPGDVEFNANLGLDGNLTYDIRAENDEGDNLTVAIEDAEEAYALGAEGWDNGNGIKYWSIKFKADGYTDFNVSSIQSSDLDNPGPKDWKLQARFSGEDWVDIPNGNVSVGEDWTTGVVENLPLPSSFDNPGTTSVYIRWIMTSNIATDDSDVLATGKSLIDNIIVKATNSTGVESTIYSANLNVFPNPCRENINIEADEEINRIEIYSANGTRMELKQDNVFKTTISTENLSSGLYFARIFFNNEVPFTKRIIVE
jgi:hypothetical protein